MFRFFGEFLSLIVGFLVLRSAISSVSQIFRGGGSGGGMHPGPQTTPERQNPQTEMQTSGELRKDPVCGTFVATTTPYTRIVNGVTTYFCSKECRDRSKAGPTTGQQWPKSSAVRS